jgi:hypothetical protein
MGVLLQKDERAPTLRVARADMGLETRNGSAAVRRCPVLATSHGIRAAQPTRAQAHGLRLPCGDRRAAVLSPRRGGPGTGPAEEPAGADVHPYIAGHLLQGRVSEAVPRPSRPAGSGTRAVTGEPEVPQVADARQHIRRLGLGVPGAEAGEVPGWTSGRARRDASAPADGPDGTAPAGSATSRRPGTARRRHRRTCPPGADPEGSSIAYRYRRVAPSEESRCPGSSPVRSRQACSATPSAVWRS